MTFGRVHSAKDFIHAAYKTPQTFNSFYASATESAFFTSGGCRCARRASTRTCRSTASGKYEWKGYLANSNHPQVINPSSGYIVNWNNKPAKNFPAGDDPLRHRERHPARRLLTGELGRRPKQTLADVLASANAAATEDVRVVAALADAEGDARPRQGAERQDPADRRPAAGVARRRRQPPSTPTTTGGSTTRARRSWTPRGRASPTPGCATASGRRSASSSRSASVASTAAGRPVRRLAPVHVEGPAHGAGRQGRGQVQPALLRQGRREDVRQGAVERPGRRRARRSRRASAPTRPRGTRPRRASRSASPRCRSSPCSTRTSRPASTR